MTLVAWASRSAKCLQFLGHLKTLDCRGWYDIHGVVLKCKHLGTSPVYTTGGRKLGFVNEHLAKASERNNSTTLEMSWFWPILLTYWVFKFKQKDNTVVFTKPKCKLGVILGSPVRRSTRAFWSWPLHRCFLRRRSHLNRRAGGHLSYPNYILIAW